MATSGSFNTTSREGRYLTFSWSVKSQDTANNKTTISWTLKGGGDSGYVYCGDFEVTIDGTKVYSSDTRREVYNTTTIASGTRTITHSADGTKTLTASVKASIYTYTQDRTGSGSWALPTIARTPTVTVSNTAKTETSLAMKWSSNLTCNRVRYRISTNSGSTWGSWTSKTVSAKSGSYTISGLTANTSYTIQTELRSSASSLTNTANKTVKTYAWPYAIPGDFTVKNGVAPYTMVNPLERPCTTVIYANETQIMEVEEDTDNGEVDLDIFEEDWLTTIPDSATGTWSIEVTYGGHTHTRTATFSGAGYNPTINVIRYADTNATAQAIIQDNATILQNISTPRFTISGTGQYGATIVGGSVHIIDIVSGTAADNVVTVNYGTIDSATDIVATATIIDSRGNSASKTIVVTMAAYTLPSAIIDLARQNNYYSETNITVDANVMSFPGNTPTITAQWKEEGAPSWEGSTTLQDNVQSTITLNNEKAWTVQVTVTDLFGGTTTYNLYVGIGLPIFYIDRMLRAVGINSFPEAGKPFVVEGVDILGELFYKPGDSFELITATQPDGTGVGGTTLPGLVTSSTKQIRLGVTVDKSLRNINSVSVSGLRGGIRTPAGGYINSNGDSTEWLTQSGITVDAFITGDKTILIRITSTASYTNVSNNMPVSMGCGHLLLEFS